VTADDSPTTATSPAEAERVLREAERAAVRLTSFLWCGNDGTVRAKAVATHRLEARMQGGMGPTRAQQAQTAQDRITPVPGMGPSGERRLRHGPGSFRLLPN
jgi:hypothetical protein